ncbi:MAG TPA: hypothetical protein VF263_23450 [Longimicrobiaceae bacterium]
MRPSPAAALVISVLLTSTLAPLPYAAAQARPSGEWTLTPLRETGRASGRVQLTLTRDAGSSVSGNSVELRRFEGLTAAQAASGSGPARFRLPGEAGTLSFDGEFRGGRGMGEFTFTPDPAFAAALERRGVGRPTANEQLRLTLRGTRLAGVDEYLAELRAAGSARPDVAGLIRALNHDVTVAYVRELAAAGYRGLGTEQLVRLRNHRVDAAFIHGLRAAGYAGLSTDELVRLHNHGVTPELARRANAGRPERLSVHQLVRMRNHGLL